MLKRFIATTAAVATITGGVVVPAQAAQNAGYDNCYITYDSNEQNVLNWANGRAFTDLRGVQLGSGYVSEHDAAVIARFFNGLEVFAQQSNPDVSRLAHNIKIANKRCAGDEYNKIPPTEMDTFLGAAFIGSLSSETSSSKDDKGSSSEDGNGITKKDGSLAPGGIALVVTAVLGGLALLGFLFPKPQ